MKQEKTVKEWFVQLPEPYKSEALEMAGIYKTLDNKYTSLFDALSNGFFFNDSPQRHDYWEDVCNRAESGEFDKPAITWPEEAKWTLCPVGTFARAADKDGRCYFYAMDFSEGRFWQPLHYQCGKITDMSGIDCTKTLEYRPSIFQK